jgi:putative transcriptional regulator
MVRRPTPEEIRAARAAAGLTQQQAAALVHRTGVKCADRWSEWENGRVPMPLAEWELFTLKTATGSLRKLLTRPTIRNNLDERQLTRRYKNVI